MDVVWCRFPEHQEPFKPGPKNRPALVKATSLDAMDRPSVQVTYGTSNLKMSQRPLDMFVTNAKDMAIAGLPQATRFDLDVVLWLPWSSDFFICREHTPTPIVGRLSSNSIELLSIIAEKRLALKNKG